MDFTEYPAYHLVDIENLTGSPRPTADQVAACRDLYRAAFVSDGDLVVIACSHRAAPVVRWSWRRGRHIWRSGPDGADLALIDAIRQDPSVVRCRRVFVGSGDGIFADDVARLGRAGIHVTAVSRPGSMSTRLRQAASVCALLPYRPSERWVLQESA